MFHQVSGEGVDHCPGGLKGLEELAHMGRVKELGFVVWKTEDLEVIPLRL